MAWRRVTGGDAGRNAACIVVIRYRAARVGIGSNRVAETARVMQAPPKYRGLTVALLGNALKLLPASSRVALRLSEFGLRILARVLARVFVRERVQLDNARRFR